MESLTLNPTEMCWNHLEQQVQHRKRPQTQAELHPVRGSLGSNWQKLRSSINLYLTALGEEMTTDCVWGACAA